MIRPSKPKRAAASSGAGILDRQLPFSLEAEMAVLGSILLRPEVCDDVALLLRPDDFYDQANRTLFEHMLQMHDTGKRIDIMLLVDSLKSAGMYETIGGAPYLAKVGNAVEIAAHAAYYSEIVRNKATYRALIHVATEVVRDAYDEAQPARDALSQAEQKIFAILDSRGTSNVASIKDILLEAVDRIDARMKGEHLHGSVETGYHALDALTGGLHNSELIVLAARPSMGKTAFAMNIAEHVALRGRAPTLFVSLEMSAIELADRLLCSSARVNGHRLRNGTISNDDRRRLVEKAAEISQSPLYVDDSPSRTVTEIAAAARRIRRRDKRLGLIVIDYLQLIEPDDPTAPRQEQVSRITRRLKGLSRELSVPVLCLAQLNRQAEASRDNKPKLSHLRECVTGDTLVLLSDGRRLPIRELVGTAPEVFSIDESGRLIAATSDAVWHVGRRPVFEVHLASGRSIRATGDHRLYGAGGWQKVKELQPGDRLAIARPEGALAAASVETAISTRRVSEGQCGLELIPSLTRRVDIGAASDLSWDRIVAIEPAGEEDVYDLTVPGPANWLADGIVSHNSGAIEQDADVVMFVHREEYYHRGDDADQYAGQAEIIISKQRNGPIGDVSLVWRKEFTRFENAASDREYDEFETFNAAPPGAGGDSEDPF